jgi:cell division protein FtsB
MKKLVLILVCALIMTVFIAFNYLLWDRENKIRNIENLNVSKNMSIDALGDKIKSLTDENKQLQEENKKKEDENNRIRSKYYLADQDLALLRKTLNNKNDVIQQLKMQADLKPLEAVIRKWAESIDKGEYEPAYELQKSQLTSGDNNIDFSSFMDAYKTNIKNIKVKDIKLQEDENNGTIQGLVFAVSLEVKLVEGADGSLYADGVNERYFTIGFDEAKLDWVIDNIAEAP